MDVYAYFTTSCYKGFSDDSEGFYTVYRTVFEKISAEDIEYMDNPEDFEKIPKFGDSKMCHEDVINFYGHWESFSTKKSYSWLFTHNISEIRDRRLLKLVDKEHKKIQQKARKDRNEEIRTLVSFVKKRDKRMAEYRKMLEEKAQQNRLKSQQNRLDQMQKRSDEIKQQQKNSKVTSEQEEHLKQLEESYLNQYSESEDDGSDVQEAEAALNDCNLNQEEANIDEDLYCVACNKFFNSQSAKLNHEASKKHKQNIELLRQEMKSEEENYQQKFKAEENGSEADIRLDEDEDEAAVEAELEFKSKGKKSKKKNKKIVNYEDSDNEIEAKENEEKIPSSETKISESDEDDWSNKKPKKSKAKTKTETKPAPPENIEELSAKPSESTESDNRCATCNQTFPSKNKLFAHLKKTNHSIYLGKLTKDLEKPSSKKKKLEQK